MVPLDKGLHNQTESGIIRHIRHNQTYPGIIQVYSDIFRTLCYPNIFKTVVYREPETYSEPRHIHNVGIFRTLAYSKSEVYSELCRTSMTKR